MQMNVPGEDDERVVPAPIFYEEPARVDSAEDDEAADHFRDEDSG